MKIRCSMALLAGGFLLLSVSATFAADEFRPRRVVKPFQPITKFPILSAKDADGKIDDAELVLGIEIDGMARAYPINMLTGPRREFSTTPWPESPLPPPGDTSVTTASCMPVKSKAKR